MNSPQAYHTNLRTIIISFWRNRQLIRQLTQREIAGRYRGSLLGLAWSFFTPLLMLAVYTFVFSVVFKSRWGNSQNESQSNFAIILFAGMIVFTIFAETINRAPTLIISNVNYVKRVVFPLEILSWVSLGTVIFHGMVSLLVLLLCQLVLNHVLPWTILLFPLILVPLMLASLGASWFLAALGVYIRDIGQLVSVLTTVLMFVSTVFYPLSALPSKYQTLLKLNPLVLIITETRNVLIYGNLPNWSSLALVWLAGILIALTGFWAFQKMRKGFADVL